MILNLFIKKILFKKNKDKKIIADLLQLIEYILSYLQAGIPIHKSIEKAFFQKEWVFDIKNIFEEIILLKNHGMTLSQAIENTLYKLTSVQSHPLLVAMLISLQVGLNAGSKMSEILRTIQERIKTNIMLQTKIKTLTTQIRFQSIIISLSPIVIGTILYIIAPEYIEFFFTSSVGIFLLFIALMLNLIGFFFLKNIGKIQ